MMSGREVPRQWGIDVGFEHTEKKRDTQEGTEGNNSIDGAFIWRRGRVGGLGGGKRLGAKHCQLEASANGISGGGRGGIP